MKTIYQNIKNWIRTDGLLHISCSALIVVFLNNFMPLWCAAIIALAFSIGKEIYDRHHNGTAEIHDIICDGIGIIIGMIICLL